MSNSSNWTITISPSAPAPGDMIFLMATGGSDDSKLDWNVEIVSATANLTASKDTAHPSKATITPKSGDVGEWKVTLKDNGVVAATAIFSIQSAESSINSIGESVSKIASEGIKVTASKTTATTDQALWVKIRQCMTGRQFKKYSEFINRNLCETKRQAPSYESLALSKDNCKYRQGVHGYEMLKAATEIFLACEACCSELKLGDVNPGDEDARLGYTPTATELREMFEQYLSSDTRRLPYLTTIIENLNLDVDGSGRFPFCEDSLRLNMCLYELIWSYWEEEGLMVQTMNAIAMRFQNRRVPGNGRDPLSNFEIAPLRPLNNLLWGYIQDGADGRRLTVARRAYEYAHEYGLQLVGKAVGEINPAESRSRFLEAFHNLLYLCADYYRENTNQWITPDPYPLLDALRSVHVLLAEGAHNQFGDLTMTARAEMMMEQWLLAQPPMSDFLQSRAMVPYDEPWMGQVDAMRRLMGWPDLSVTYFHRLAVYGEQILLSIRWGNWSALTTTSEQAANWALYWKPEIQGYIESYRSVTRVELAPSFRASVPVDTTQPGVHIRRRQQETQAKAGRP